MEGERWVTSYKNEMGYLPNNPTFLRTYVVNRGGSLTFKDARELVNKAKAEYLSQRTAEQSAERDTAVVTANPTEDLKVNLDAQHSSSTQKKAEQDRPKHIGDHRVIPAKKSFGSLCGKFEQKIEENNQAALPSRDTEISTTDESPFIRQRSKSSPELNKSHEIQKHTLTGSLQSLLKKVTSGTGLDFQMHVTKGDKPISFWHDVPLFPVNVDAEVLVMQSNCVNFVCEIPKTTRKKFEVSTKGEGNPIKQDTKNGKLREYSKGDIWFNYGCLPRTWEDTEFVHPDVGFPGDGDPLDACEIGMRMLETGEIRETKVLGVLCMIDEDETDWKLICIDVEDRWASELNNVEDVDRLLPGALDQIREWWRTYKVTDGKPLNKFGLDEKFMPAEYAMDIVVECHEAWKKACAKQSGTGEQKKIKSSLSFSKLEDLDLTTDACTIEKLIGS